MAPPKHRGAFNKLFQLSITLGIFVANLINYGTAKLKNGSVGWRISLGTAALKIIFALLLPDTPSSLLAQGHVDEARRILKRVHSFTSDTEIEMEFSDMIAASEASKKVKAPWSKLFQQMMGMNIVVFYAPELFNSIKIGSRASLASALITGGDNMLVTFFAIWGVDRLGRRGIQILVLQIAMAGLIGSKFGTTGAVADISMFFGIAVVVIICFFVMGFAWSWGPLGWLVPSEIFSLVIWSPAQSVVVAVNMLMTFVLAQIFLMLLCHLKFGLFIFFACIILAMTTFIYFLLPETKGIPIEEMHTVWEDHKFWRNYVEVFDRGDSKFRGLELGSK